MSKFLKIIENTSPEADYNTLKEAKLSLNSMLVNLNIPVDYRVFQNILFITLTDKRIVELEVKSISDPKEKEKEEEAEDDVEAITTIAGLPDEGLGPKLRGAKDQVEQAFLIAAKRLTDGLQNVGVK